MMAINLIDVIVMTKIGVRLRVITIILKVAFRRFNGFCELLKSRGGYCFTFCKLVLSSTILLGSALMYLYSKLHYIEIIGKTYKIRFFVALALLMCNRNNTNRSIVTKCCWESVTQLFTSCSISGTEFANIIQRLIVRRIAKHSSLLLFRNGCGEHTHVGYGWITIYTHFV